MKRKNPQEMGTVQKACSVNRVPSSVVREYSEAIKMNIVFITEKVKFKGGRGEESGEASSVGKRTIVRT